MNIKRAAKKLLLPNKIGWIADVRKIHKETGKSLVDSSIQSVKELFTEDLPGTSHIYDAGKFNGEKEGRARQAEVDAEKMSEMNKAYEKNLSEKNKIITDQNKLIDDLGKEAYKD